VAAILDAVTHVPDGGGAGLSVELEPLREDPERAAILTDVDGTLAPIVARPELAAVPARARAALAALSERYGLVGCVSGRRVAEARRLVGVEGIAYSGNHGLELLAPGEEEPRLDPALREPGAAASLLARLDGEALAAAGLRVEDKGPIQALHWRGAEDEAGAEALAREVADRAGEAGLHPHWGRKVLELRPLAAVGKDRAVRALLTPTAQMSYFPPHTGGKYDIAVYAGDDTTDLDAFRGLRELREGGHLETAICIGVASPEAPPELAREATVAVGSPEDWLAILEELAA
jgi:trehalose 6-phosphate phosphatase